MICKTTTYYYKKIKDVDKWRVCTMLMDWKMM